MSKRRKLPDDNYLDSASIVHGKKKLSTLLDKLLNRNSLVKSITFNESTNAIEIDGLDIIKDGGVYEIFGQLQSANEDGFGIAMNLNGIIGNSCRNETIFNYDTSEVFHYRGVNEGFGIYLGEVTQLAESYFHITLYRRSENRIYYELRAGIFKDTKNRQYVENGLVKTGQDNITSIKIKGITTYNDLFTRGEIKIFKKQY